MIRFFGKQTDTIRQTAPNVPVSERKNFRGPIGTPKTENQAGFILFSLGKTHPAKGNALLQKSGQEPLIILEIEDMAVCPDIFQY